MLRLCKGDLLESNFDVIGHQVNCQSKMGAGIALQIRDKFPGSYNMFIDDKRAPEKKLGDCLCFETGLKAPSFVFHLYGQLNYGKREVFTDYPALQQSLNKMIRMTKELEVALKRPLKIALPYKLGCGLAGGNWTIVNSIIEFISIESGTNIYLCKI